MLNVDLLLDLFLSSAAFLRAGNRANLVEIAGGIPADQPFSSMKFQTKQEIMHFMYEM